MFYGGALQRLIGSPLVRPVELELVLEQFGRRLPLVGAVELYTSSKTSCESLLCLAHAPAAPLRIAPLVAI